MTSCRSIRRATVAALLFVLAGRAAAQPAEPAQMAASDETLTLLSVDVRTLPGAGPQSSSPAPPAWRTSFGSERRSEKSVSPPQTAVDADIVLLQGVTDFPLLRRWFPARNWKLVVSRQLFDPAGETGEFPAPAARTRVPTTAIAVRLRTGLRLTGRDHLLELATPSSTTTDAAPAAAGTAVRVQIDRRETWAISVLLPEECQSDCPARVALQNWYQKRDGENVRRVTAGRFRLTADPAAAAPCGGLGLELHPAPPPPRPAFFPATVTPDLGCAASVQVAK